MPKRSRLTRKDHVAHSPARRVHGAYSSLSYAAGSGAAKFACVVSKKVAAKAFARNLMKRRCREICRSEANALPGGVYIVTAKRAAATATFADLKADIERLLRAVRDR